MTIRKIGNHIKPFWTKFDHIRQLWTLLNYFGLFLTILDNWGKTLQTKDESDQSSGAPLITKEEEEKLSLSHKGQRK